MADTNVVELETGEAPNQPRPDIAETLRDLANEAEQGRIQSLAMAYLMPDGAIGEWMPKGKCTDIYVLIGGLENLKRSLLKMRDDYG